MSKLQIMDHSGHTTVEFDNATKNGVTEAMARFNELVKEKKYTAGAKVAGGDGQFRVVRDFDPTAEEIVLMPPLQGG